MRDLLMIYYDSSILQGQNRLRGRGVTHLGLWRCIYM